ncbi:MAG: hypothetical protein LBM93_10815 [Oscillospiraceae bacterium]|jgi:chromosome segregation ATPase|nr:hypothetical protein [Oscillospiraceae bacterium]
MAEEVGALIETKAMEKGFTKASVLAYMDNLNTQISELKKKNRELESAPAPVQQTVKTVVDDTKINQLTQQVQAEHQARLDEKKAYETEKMALNNKMAELTKSATGYLQELEKCRKLLVQSEQKNNTIAGKTEATTGELAIIQKQLDAKTAQVDSLMKNIEEAETKLTEANIKLTETNNAKAKLEKELSDKDSEVAEWKLKAEKAAPIDITNIDISNVSPIVQQILDGAQAAAETTKREVAKEVEATREEADSYARRVKSEADDYSKKCHRDADGYALGVKAEADKYADKTRSDADVYCKQVTSTADLESKTAVEKAKSEATKIIGDASKEALNTKADAERESLQIASHVKDIKDLLKNQINAVSDNLSNISSMLIGITADAQKTIEKATTATKSALDGVDSNKIDGLLKNLDDIKAGKKIENNVNIKPNNSNSKKFDLKELTKAVEGSSSKKGGFGTKSIDLTDL